MNVIEFANIICSWRENLSADEVPPAWMWPHTEELNVWFEDVERKRDEKYGTGSSSPADEVVPLMENEYAAQFRPPKSI